uniref:Uncharacterized protein n=1 Tax=Knipowitschia caucasica TaxID=637954 RepID=A0AAV2LAJ8_KNICA
MAPCQLVGGGNTSLPIISGCTLTTHCTEACSADTSLTLVSLSLSLSLSVRFLLFVLFCTLTRPGFPNTAHFHIALPCLLWIPCSKHTKVMLPKSCLSPSEKEKG